MKKVLGLIVLFCLMTSHALAYTVVQTANNGTIMTPTLVINVSATSGGDALKVMAGSTSSTAGITCADNKGNSYTAQQTGGASGIFGTLFTCDAATSGVTTITLTYPDSTIHAAVAREYSGLSAIDQKTSSAATGPNPTSGSTGTTSSANEMVFGGLVVNTNPGLSSATVGSGFGNFATKASSGAAFQVAIEDKSVSSTATYSATFVDSNTTPYFCIVETDTLPSVSVTTPNYVISY